MCFDNKPFYVKFQHRATGTETYLKGKQLSDESIVTG